MHLFLIILFFIFSCKGDKNLPQKEQVKKPEFQMGIIKVSDLSKGIQVLGSVSYYKKAEITSKVLGRLEKYYKEESDPVKAGELIAKIETLNLQIQAQKDKSAIDVQKKQRKLNKAKLILAKQRVERDIANIEKADADLRDAIRIAENLDRTAKNKAKLNEIGAVSESELKSIETSLNSANIAKFKAEKNLANLQIGYRDEDLKSAKISVPSKFEDKQKSLIKLNTVLEKAELDMAKANLRAAIKNLESTQLLIKESFIKSPISGLIATRSKEIGEFVKEGEAIYIVVDTSQVLLKFNVNESNIWKLQLNQKVVFTADAYPAKKFEGKVYIISPIVDPQTRTVEVKVMAQNEKLELRPGMFTRGTIISEEKTDTKIFELPISSVTIGKDKESGTIFIANEKSLLFKKKVQIIKAGEKTIQISGEIKEGDWYAYGNIANIQEGQSVDLKEYIKENEKEIEKEKKKKEGTGLNWENLKNQILEKYSETKRKFDELIVKIKTT